MKIVCSTGGSGSSSVAGQFKRAKWKICKRPDGGKLKSAGKHIFTFRARMKPFFHTKKADLVKMNECELFDFAMRKLRKKDTSKTFMNCFRWGGLGFFNEYPDEVIFLIRDPVFAFNSYSGLGWRPEGGKRRMKMIGASGPNDVKWIDAFLDDFAMWIDTAKNALICKKAGHGKIIRYHKLNDDWGSIDAPFSYTFKSRDDPSKLGNLNRDTIEYIRNRTDDIWTEIKSF